MLSESKIYHICNVTGTIPPHSLTDVTLVNYQLKQKSHQIKQKLLPCYRSLMSFK